MERGGCGKFGAGMATELARALEKYQFSRSWDNPKAIDVIS